MQWRFSRHEPQQSGSFAIGAAQCSSSADSVAIYDRSGGGD